jgi:hypothetical protein
MKALLALVIGLGLTAPIYAQGFDCVRTLVCGGGECQWVVVCPNGTVVGQ